MSILHRIEWPAVLRRLLDRADPALLDRCGHQLTLTSPIRADVAVFAAAVCGLPRVALLDALSEAGLGAHTDRVTDWIREQAHVVFAVHIHGGEPARQEEPAPAGPLVLDPDLDALPLLDLAADIAAVRGLIVEIGRLPDGAAGCFNAHTRRLTLDREHGITPDAWAHELSHALDPDVITRQAPDLNERFAHMLGPLLLDAQPATVRQAQPLVDACLSRLPTPDIPEHHDDNRCDSSTALPAPGVTSLAAFMALDVAGTRRTARQG